MVNKSKMLSAGVADVVLKFLPSEMPPVQFKLLGTLRMLIDTQGLNKQTLELKERNVSDHVRVQPRQRISWAPTGSWWSGWWSGARPKITRG